MRGQSGANTFLADTPQKATKHMAMIMGVDADIRLREAYLMNSEIVDNFVWIGLRVLSSSSGFIKSLI